VSRKWRTGTTVPEIKITVEHFNYSNPKSNSTNRNLFLLLLVRGTCKTNDNIVVRN